MKNNATPFLKWAGGKKQLLTEFDKRLPPELKNGEINKYVEPFIGGGAVFFDIIQKFKIDESYIFDVNEELILAYQVVKNDVESLIEVLRNLESEYLVLNEEARKILYYDIRDRFNENKNKIDFSEYNRKWIDRAAHIIFLNKTCFNGLFRVNSKGGFNVPFGRYKNPKILNENNLRNVSSVLEKTHINRGDFSDCEPFLDTHTFVYFDPPYRPINKTSSFTSYSKDNFNENDQLRLAKFYNSLDAKGTKIMLSNSDPKNENPNDNFFEENFSNFNIERVNAKRNINCNGLKRGSICELIITNYSY